MAVAVDQIDLTDVTANAATSISLTTLTVGAGSNRFLIAGLTLQSLGSAPSLHWDTAGTNQALTLIGSVADSGGAGRVYLYGLVAPTSGNKLLGATWTGASDVTLAGACFTGVDQSTPTAHLNTNTGSASPSSVVITSAVGNYVIGLMQMNGSLSSPTPTQWYLDNAPNNFSSAGADGTGAATVTLSFVSGATPWSVIGIDLVAAAGAAAKVAYQPQYQLAPIMAQ